jgi:hypothetical protein
MIGAQVALDCQLGANFGFDLDVRLNSVLVYLLPTTLEYL